MAICRNCDYCTFEENNSISFQVQPYPLIFRETIHIYFSSFSSTFTFPDALCVCPVVSCVHWRTRLEKMGNWGKKKVNQVSLIVCPLKGKSHIVYPTAEKAKLRLIYPLSKR